MTDQTPNLALDYLMPDQAQKHITINDSLRRLDALVHLSVVNRSTTNPPTAPANGVRYLVPQTAQGEWATHENQIAFYEDTGWQYLVPRIGWRLWDEAENIYLIYNGTIWQAVSASSTSANGGSGSVAIEKTEIVVRFPNPEVINIPMHSLFFGVTGRVQQTMSGATNFRVGVQADNQRFGSRISRVAGSTFQGLANPPAVYWSPTPLLITGEGRAISAGTLKLALYHLSLPIPS
ncbi:MAG: DUF2793 domain-containing protein [Alphaproteobacteria bacterium]|nr:DUF2793 domain-containing protein [Alphaproteobacteria bacterium]MBE8219860.1 DUF2793 domain-containing protein [Alphaproteobacteria bacterium]